MQPSTPRFPSSSSSPKLPDLLDCDHERDQTHDSLCMMTSSLKSNSILGDCIGTESCFDVISGDSQQRNEVAMRDNDDAWRVRADDRKRLYTSPREFPPPIPLLARTGNLISRMPWILRREYVDGRLILREERVKRHEYFHAHRSNGRLTLKLVVLDDDLLNLSKTNDGFHSAQIDVDNHVNDEGGQNADEGNERVIVEENTDTTVTSSQPLPSHSPGTDATVTSSRPLPSHPPGNEIGGMGSGSPSGKCSKDSFMGMPMPEIRPVIS